MTIRPIMVAVPSISLERKRFLPPLLPRRLLQCLLPPRPPSHLPGRQLPCLLPSLQNLWKRPSVVLVAVLCNDRAVCLFDSSFMCEFRKGGPVKRHSICNLTPPAISRLFFSVRIVLTNKCLCRWWFSDSIECCGLVCWLACSPLV